MIVYLFASFANGFLGAVGDHVTLLAAVAALVREAAVSCLVTLLCREAIMIS